jgi:MFS family permease
VLAVANRTSLSALGPMTQEHFSIDATALSSFTVLQLVVYAGMQVPVGALLDRYGSKAMVLSGGVIMLAGQLLMAMTEHVWLAVVARMLVGAGDAFTFISVVRLLPAWFPPRSLPLMGQLTFMCGNLGQLVSVLPLAFAVDRFGWATGFIGIAAVGALVVLLAVVLLRDRPVGAAGLEPDDSPVSESVAPTPAGLRGALSRPGVRLAFWVHFTAGFPQHLFLLLWGTPLLVGGLRFTTGQAAATLSGMVLVGVFIGLVLGRVTGRYAEQRVPIVIGSVSTVALAWIALLVVPGMPPLWLTLLTITLTSSGGALSMVALDVARTHAPARSQGLAAGFVNMGAFIATLTAVFLIGLVLDLQGAGTPDTYELGAFKLAFATQVPLWALGIGMLVLEFRRTRRGGGAR